MKARYYLCDFLLTDEPLSSTGFTTWRQTQPDNAWGNEDCGSIDRSGLLNDIRCTEQYAFFCEHEL